MRTVAKRVMRLGVVCAALVVCGGYFDGDGRPSPSGGVLRAAGPCDPPANAIVAENCLPGAPRTEWDIAGAGSTNIQGFTTDFSVAKGEIVNFKVDVDPAGPYRLDIYRLGYYQGNGARSIASVTSLNG